MNKAFDFLDEISKNWKLDGWEENPKYFYFSEEVKRILSGEISFVIGRKGSGKSTISKNIIQNNSNEVVKNISFYKMPYDEIERLGIKDTYEMVLFWKYIIYSELCFMINENSEIKENNKLFKHLFSTENPFKEIIKIKNLAIKTPLFSAEVSFDEKKYTINELVDKMETIIFNEKLNKRYFLFFDELDSGFDINRFDNYLGIIKGLLKSIAFIKRELIIGSKNKFNVSPIAFIRDDIYDNIYDNDKAKWEDKIIYISWDEKSIMKMLNHRICAMDLCNAKEVDFNTSWLKICNDKLNKNCSFEGFKNLSRQTQYRPRDYIKFLAIASRIALDNKARKINKHYLNQANREFSEYLLKEMKDELHVYIPNIDVIFSIIQEITFETNSNKFIGDFKEKLDERKIKNEYLNTLNYLFRFGVIGNYDNNTNKVYFSFRNNQLSINTKQSFIIHPGLRKALQIYS
jgi:Fe-S cluster assembly ATPase SufC